MDVLQPSGAAVLCCPADLVSYSAITRYVIREFGQEERFRLRPTIGTAEPNLVNSPTAPWDNEIFGSCTRASNKHPMLHEVLHLCLTNLIHKLHQNDAARIHFPLYDPERSINLLPAWYATLREIVLHNRVYVSIASITSANIT